MTCFRSREASSFHLSNAKSQHIGCIDARSTLFLYRCRLSEMPAKHALKRDEPDAFKIHI